MRLARMLIGSRPMKTHRALTCLTSFILLSSLNACGSSGDDPSGSPSPNGKSAIDPSLGGKADGDRPPVVEAGRFLENGTRTGAFDGASLPAFRVASFGNTKLRLSLEAVDESFDPVLVVDGPVPSAKVVAFNDDADGGTMNAALELTLEQAGTYRVVVGSYAAFQGLPPESGTYSLTYECVEGCSFPQMSLASFVDRVKADHGEELVEKLLVERAAAMFDDEALAASVGSQARDFLNGAGATDAFPVVPLAALAGSQGLLELAVDAENTAAPEPVTFVLDDLLRESCTPERGGPQPLIAEIPELARGAATDHRFDDCALLHAQQLAEVLNNLSLDNGSAVVANGQRYETVESAIRALIDAGHTIEAQNNRYYADFLGLSYQGVSVAAPVWVDTGMPLPSGGTLVVPATHAHYHFVIEGPLLNAEVMFYMGIPGGTAFRAHHTYRKPWAGERSSLRRNTSEDLETVVSLFVTAGKLRKKWFSEGAGLPAEGYGQLGVCLDSTAVLEMATEKSVSLFPLAHPVPANPQTDIDLLLASIPSDFAGNGNDTAFNRLVASQPFDASKGVDLDAMPFPTLKAELEDLGVAAR